MKEKEDLADISMKRSTSLEYEDERADLHKGLPRCMAETLCACVSEMSGENDVYLPWAEFDNDKYVYMYSEKFAPVDNKFYLLCRPFTAYALITYSVYKDKEKFTAEHHLLDGTMFRYKVKEEIDEEWYKGYDNVQVEDNRSGETVVLQKWENCSLLPELRFGGSKGSLGDALKYN